MKKFPIVIILGTLLVSLIIIIKHNLFFHDNNRYRVVCTTTFLADALTHIAGDSIEVTSLMQPGIDPHLYKATENDMHQIAHADLIIYHGLHLEGKMAELFKAMKSYKPTFAACKILSIEDLRTTDNAHCYDPHVWFAVPLWIQVVRHLANILCDNYPKHTALYRQNTENYCAQLQELHSYICTQAEKLPLNQRILITAHDAFGYFGQTYGFTVIGLQGISTDSDISLASVQNLAQYIATHNVSTIFTELGIPHKSIQALEQAVFRYHKKIFIGPELYTDSLGDATTPASDYISLMQYTIDVLVQSLQVKEQNDASST